ncbi:caldesmon-like [Pleurodeles waltl]
MDILALGDELLTSKKIRRRKQEPAPSAGPAPAEIMADESDDDSTDRLEGMLSVYRTLAEEGKQRALKEQEESFTKLLEEVARNRDHLEAERLEQFRRKLERERSEALQAQKKGFEVEKQHAVKAACAELRLQIRREVETERSRDVEKALAAAAVEFQKELEVAVMAAQGECWTQAAEERSKLLHQHRLEIQTLHGQIADFRHEISRLHQEKKAYECQFQEVQLNYKRFIDLTDSSLHSDYLLRLQRLGLPPGHADAGVQTERAIAKQSGH